MEMIPKKKFENEGYNLHIGYMVHVRGIRDDGQPSWPIPFKVVEIQENPSGGADLVKLSRSAHTEDAAEELRWFRAAGFEVDDSSNKDEIYIVVPIDTVAEKEAPRK